MDTMQVSADERVKLRWEYIGSRQGWASRTNNYRIYHRRRLDRDGWYDPRGRVEGYSVFQTDGDWGTDSWKSSEIGTASTLDAAKKLAEHHHHHAAENCHG